MNRSCTWNGLVIDVGAIWNDIRTGALQPATVRLGRDFLCSYAEQFLRLGNASSGPTQKPPLVDLDEVLALPREQLYDPVLIAFVGRGNGCLALDDDPASSPDYVLADGQHRIARAYLDRLPGLRAMIVDDAFSPLYWRQQPAYAAAA